MRRVSFALALVFSSVLCAQAQTLPLADKKQVIGTLSKEMIDRYVDRAAAERVAAHLKMKLEAGGFDKEMSGDDFARMLREEVNSICPDAHFRIRYSATALPVRKNRDTPSPAEIEEQAQFSRRMNAGWQEVQRLPGNIGYIRFDQFLPLEESGRPLRASMDFVQNADALIFDLRNNGGGHPETVRAIMNYLFAKPTHLNSLWMRQGDRMVEEKSVSKPQKGSKFFDCPVYVLVSRMTGSAAEEFAYNLQTRKRATIIGEKTWGGANPGGSVRLTDHFIAFIPFGMAKNPVTGTNWEGVGVTPDRPVDPNRAMEHAQLEILKTLLPNTKGQFADALRARIAELEKLLG